MESHDVILKFSRAEAVVLFEWVTRFNKSAGTKFEDQAEARVLWNIEAMLEATLVEPFKSDYSERLAHARAAVRDSEE